jgi:hypothetical protein
MPYSKYPTVPQSAPNGQLRTNAGTGQAYLWQTSYSPNVTKPTPYNSPGGGNGYAYTAGMIYPQQTGAQPAQTGAPVMQTGAQTGAPAKAALTPAQQQAQWRQQNVWRPGQDKDNAGLAQVTSTPRRDYLFTPAQTAQAAAMQASTARQGSDADFLMGQLDRPGVSRSLGTLSAVLPQVAGGQVAANRAMQETPLMHALLNTNYQADAQAQQGQEALGLFNVLRRNQATNDYTQLSSIDQLLRALL